MGSELPNVSVQLLDGKPDPPKWYEFCNIFTARFNLLLEEGMWYFTVFT